MLRENIEQVRERIVRSASRAGRNPDDITLIAVTKKFPASAIRESYELGLREFGENYVQEFENKAPELPNLPGARFHLIGHLQSNKAKKAAELFQVIQTVHSAKLARRLAETDTQLEVMIEVKLSGEDSKSGVAPSDLVKVIEAIRALPQFSLTGLMTMPPWTADPELSRPFFSQLRKLAEEHHLTGLSMGMSHDMEAAIEEGATRVRIGTALYGPRRKP